MKKVILSTTLILLTFNLSKAQFKKMNEYIEIAKFKLKTGYSDQQFINAEAQVRESNIKKQKGFISRELIKDSNGNWLMIMRFDTKQNMDTWFEDLKKDNAMKVLGSMIDFESVRMEFFVKKI